MATEMTDAEQERLAEWTGAYDKGALFAQTGDPGQDEILNPNQIAGWIRGYEDNK